MSIISSIISTLIQCLAGWLLIEKVPGWLNITGFFATVIRIIGVLIIIRAFLAWF